MNRRGELEKAIAQTYVGASPNALFNQLLRRANNKTGEIPDDRFAPRMETLTRQAKLGRSTAYRALGELRKHEWFREYANTARASSPVC